MRVYRNFCNKGFTLVELLVVIAIIAILFAVVLVAINPAQRFKDSRNSRRLADVKSIVEAVTTYTADRRGAQLPDVPDYQCVGTKPADSFSTIPTGSTVVWKFDDSLNDAASFDNLLTSNSTTYTINSSGKFGEAIQMNGTTSSLSVGDHAELNPVLSALTLEGWMKLNQKIEPGSFDHHQTLFDKGNYRLQINSDSGKLELETQNGSVWSPDYDTSSTNIKGINTFAQFQGSLYAGGINTSDQAVLLKKNGGTWSSVSNYPATNPSITALAVYNGKMYSGQMSGRVYAFDGLSWTSTNLETLTGSADVLSLARYKGKLYAGLGSAGGASVWSYDGTSWSISKQFDQTTQAVAVYALTVYNGKLYAGTGRGALSQEARLFEYNGNAWTQQFMLVKDGVYSLVGYNKELYIGFGGDNAVTDDVIYKGDGSTFSQIGSALGGSGTKSYIFSLGVFDGTIFAGRGGIAGDGDVYYWNGAAWAPDVDNASSAEIRSLYSFKGELYAGGRGANDAQSGIWAYGSNGFLESQKTKWFPNVWYHIAGTYDGASSIINLMINGYLDATTSSSVPGTLTTNTKTLNIGSGYSSDPFDGALDNFAIYNNTALSADEVASHAGCYNLGQYLAPEYMGSLPIDPSSEVTDGTDTGYFLSKDTGGVITITAPLTEITSSIPEIIKASR